MICHQRVIREQAALTPDPDEDEKREAAASFDNASVEEIDYQTAKEFILRYEWLGNMGTTVRTIGLWFKHPTTGERFLAGVNCFGHPKSTAILNICGAENADSVYWLARGACAYWAHPNSGSHIITAACKLMGKPWKTRDGKDMPSKFVFVATADSDAGEIGQLYQSCGWNYVGKTTSDRMFLEPGQPKERAKSYQTCVKNALRDRTGRVEQAEPDGRRHFILDGYNYYHGDTLPSGEIIVGSDKYPYRLRAEYVGMSMKEAEAVRLAEVLKTHEEIEGNRKLMYVGIYSDNTIRGRKQRKELVEALFQRKKVLDYPKRAA
jgi:hypothetical protein